MENETSAPSPFITGKAFNAKNTQKLYKLTNALCCHNGFQYQEGLNIDTKPLNSHPCSAGGLYLTFEGYLYVWLRYNNQDMTYVWDVEIPDEATVFEESLDKIKADRLILTRRRLIKDMEDWNDIPLLLKATLRHWGQIGWLYEDNPDLQLRMVQYDPTLVRYIRDPSKAIQVEAVNRCGTAIMYIDEPCEEAQLEALRQDSRAYRWIPFPCSSAIDYYKKRLEEAR